MCIKEDWLYEDFNSQNDGSKGSVETSLKGKKLLVKKSAKVVSLQAGLQSAPTSISSIAVEMYVTYCLCCCLYNSVIKI